MNSTAEAIDPLARMHSAEHVLNAVMQRDLGTGRSVEVHFGAKKSKCDYVVERPLTAADVEAIQAAVNAEISADHPVTTFEISRREAEATVNMSKVPDDARTIRIVRIGDLDLIPCIGRHVEHTSQIGRFAIRSADMRDETVVRIRFALSDE
jgi:Ser-tRNA(Ala) deacylase AlaX